MLNSIEPGLARLQEGDSAAREALWLAAVAAALEHSVRGVIQHRSVHCAVLTTHFMTLWQNRGGEAGRAARAALWEQLKAALHTENMLEPEGWADPLAEELPVTMAAER